MREVTRKTERNLLYIFGNDSRSPGDRASISMRARNFESAKKRIARAKRDISVDLAGIFTRRYQRAIGATIVNVSPRDGIQNRHT